MSDEERGTRPAWPYTSFKTVLNFVLKLHENQAVPPRIDRSILGGSEGQKTQVLAALKFFGLIKDNGDVTPLLMQLVNEEKQRPRLIAELLRQRYPDATALAAVNATGRQLEETFSPLTGDTLRKAVTFYLHAAKFANHPLSKNFKVRSGYNRRPGNRQRQGSFEPLPTPPPANPHETDAKARYLDLLLERAKTADGTLDEKLLDRIEKLLGYTKETQQ
jgi:hypothetical protein